MTLNQRTMNNLGKRGDQTASADSILGLDLGLGEQGGGGEGGGLPC